MAHISPTPVRRNSFVERNRGLLYQHPTYALSSYSIGNVCTAAWP